MPDKAWKALERRVAATLGGWRSGPLGRHGSDVDGAFFSVQVKRTSRMPCSKWLAQAKRDGKQEGKPWLLVVAGHNDARPVAMLDLYVLAELAQKAGLVGAVEINEEIGE